MSVYRFTMCYNHLLMLCSHAITVQSRCRIPYLHLIMYTYYSIVLLFYLVGCTFHFVLLKRHLKAVFHSILFSGSYTFHSYTFHSYTLFYSSTFNLYTFHSYTFHLYTFHSYTFHSSDAATGSILQNFIIFTEKQLCSSLFLINLQT